MSPRDGSAAFPWTGGCQEKRPCRQNGPCSRAALRGSASIRRGVSQGPGQNRDRIEDVQALTLKLAPGAMITLPCSAAGNEGHRVQTGGPVPCDLSFRPEAVGPGRVSPGRTRAPKSADGPLSCSRAAHDVHGSRQRHRPYRLISTRGAPITLFNNKLPRSRSAQGLVNCADAPFRGHGRRKGQGRSRLAGLKATDCRPASWTTHRGGNLSRGRSDRGIAASRSFAPFKMTLDYHKKRMTFVPAAPTARVMLAPGADHAGSRDAPKVLSAGGSVCFVAVQGER